jgi:glycerol-3-phosphate dehydrogenase (NAD(P)+)
MPNSHRVAVLGGGSFGTVIANLVALNGSRVSLWLRNSQRATHINTHAENTDYLPDYQLHSNLRATCSQI